MSYNSYSGYSGNPYASDNPTPEQTTQNPYAPTGGYGQSNPYENQGYGVTTQPGQQAAPSDPAALHAGSQPPAPGQPMTNADFLSRVEAAKADIRHLTGEISSIASLHQRSLSSTDSSASAALSAQTSQTQVLTTSIRDQIKALEVDAARSGAANTVKASQVGQLKTSFRRQLEEFRAEEVQYEKRYREQIARQFRIVNPDATDAEVDEAANANWGDEGVFQTALKSNRTATATSVLGSVRARHADIQKIEQTLTQLNQLFQDLAEQVILQEPAVATAEQHTEDVKRDTEAGNVQLKKGIDHARRARKLKWWCFWICVLIICILALVLGLVFGLKN